MNFAQNSERDMDTNLNFARNLLAEILNVSIDGISNESSILTLNEWDSLAHMRIILRLEEIVGTQLPTEKILEIENVIDIANALSLSKIKNS